jgi:2-iminobutanoate/2-iminopropanoate deaminase
MSRWVTTAETRARPASRRKVIPKEPISAPQVLKEAHEYPRPSSFSRGLRPDIKGITILFITGTASVDENGQTVHAGDFCAQTWRSYRNFTALLEAEGATWKDVVRTTCYLRDMERDYTAFNEVRTRFFKEQGLNALPHLTASWRSCAGRIRSSKLRPSRLLSPGAGPLMTGNRRMMNPGLFFTEVSRAHFGPHPCPWGRARRQKNPGKRASLRPSWE